MPSSRPSERRLPRPARLGLYVLYALTALALIRAAFIVPGQLEELWVLEHGEPFEGTPISTRGEAVLSGSVVEVWNGERAADVRLEVTRYPVGEALADDGEPWAPSRPRKLRANAAGDFELEVAPGLYRIRVEDPDFDASNGYQAVVDLAGQTPSPLVVGVHRACELEAELIDAAGEPVPGAELFIKSGDPGRAFFTPQPYGMASTDEDGVASWRCRCGELEIRQAELPGGRIRYLERSLEVDESTPRQTLTLAEVEAGGTSARTQVLVRRDPADERPVLDLVPAPREGAPEQPGQGRVSGRLVGPGGEPVRAQILIDTTGWPRKFEFAYLRFLPWWPVTDERGGFTTPLPAGRHRLYVMPAGGAPVVLQPFDVAAGEEVDLGELTVPRRASHTVTGRVLGPDGAVGGAEVYPVATGEIGRLFLSALNTGPFPRTLTAPDGTFELGGLPPDEVVLMAYHRDVGAGDAVAVSLVEGPVAEVELRLRPGSADLRMGWVAGAWFEVNRDGLLLTRVIEGSVSHRAGLRPGDRLLTVDGTSVRWFEKQRMFAVLGREAPIPPSKLTVARPGETEPVVLTWPDYGIGVVSDPAPDSDPDPDPLSASDPVSAPGKTNPS